ncbi:hypothetical protein BCV70DRAFT_13664 [Testicularia cyperi]|uniref:Uncharacterized protein n=1 Tax=Testicularia cyperi TaxID=1882483 RepID=A0A317XY53_9BASI|nr:hypothetical protein BCV70DRAFT_13664 [Testicularia cyperi]
MVRHPATSKMVAPERRGLLPRYTAHGLMSLSCRRTRTWTRIRLVGSTSEEQRDGSKFSWSSSHGERAARMQDKIRNSLGERLISANDKADCCTRHACRHIASCDATRRSRSV